MRVVEPGIQKGAFVLAAVAAYKQTKHGTAIFGERNPNK
jgi:hypothetical protein